jgi:hypothetical protein
MRSIPCAGESTPPTRALRVYSPREKKAASEIVIAIAATLNSVKDKGRISTMRPSHELARALSDSERNSRLPLTWIQSANAGSRAGAT